MGLNALFEEMTLFAVGPGLNYKKLMISIMGIERPSVRFQELAHLAVHHLQKLKDMPALRSTLQLHGMLRWPTNANRRLTTVKNDLKKYKMKRLHLRYGKRAALIPREARTNAGVDRAITMDSIDLAKAVLAWRKGAWGARRFKKCVCVEGITSSSTFKNVPCCPLPCKR